MVAPRDVDTETLNKMRESFYLDGGTLRFKRKSGPKRAGDSVGTLSGSGYLITRFLGLMWPVHRIVYFLHYNKWPDKMQVDHIDGDKTNNRPENLRLVSDSDNRRSFSKPHGTSCYRGVSYDKESSKWRAVISMRVPEPRVFHLGRFTCEREAALAYNYKAESLGFYKESFNKVFEDVSEELLNVET